MPHGHRRRKRNFSAWFLACIRLHFSIRPVCDIPPADLFQMTTLTCYFPEEVFQSDFKVIHLPSNTSVVNATWRDEKYAFSLVKGFSMDGQQNKNRFIFKLDQITRNQTGTYKCLPKGKEEDDIGICTLFLESEFLHESTDAYPVEQVTEGAKQGSDRLYTVLFAVFLILFIIVAAGLVSVICVTKPYFKRGKEVDNSKNCNDPYEHQYFLNGKEHELEKFSGSDSSHKGRTQ